VSAKTWMTAAGARRAQQQRDRRRPRRVPELLGVRPRRPGQQGGCWPPPGIVGSAAAITGAGIAAWALPSPAAQPAHAEGGTVEAARLTAFTPPATASPGGLPGISRRPSQARKETEERRPHR
jgi:hypothetical protein